MKRLLNVNVINTNASDINHLLDSRNYINMFSRFSLRTSIYMNTCWGFSRADYSYLELLPQISGNYKFSIGLCETKFL
jgi:hypothetical protein